ncbi:hypothetical protein G7Y89_g13094 [Cudoniella acicularis]|uniref:Response regulatory domain-containing protein n=1 Tax=Cudoniella acicularis TaxID=354080 RepID=A0A8H4R8W4_9HELO|nr:hypothetical protein G7Y89_g13094 [Cudoniella acicularis]
MGASLENPSDSGASSVEYIRKSTSGGQDQTAKAEWGDGEIIYLTIAVKDTGHGLSEKERRNIFNLYQQASPKTHVQYNGSELEACDVEIHALKNGVKMSNVSIETNLRTPSPAPQSPKALRILVVEANFVNQKVVTKQLRKSGHVVSVANHGEEVLDFIRRLEYWVGDGKEGVNGLHGERLSVILMDLETPVMEGLTFIRYLSSSTNMLILAGAGLSASAGIPTFRGNGGYWRGHKATAISNIECFEELPALSWVYHAERRKMVIEAKPGRGHEVLAEVTRKWRGGKRKGNVKKGGGSGGVCMLTQNIDGLSEKAKHPQDRLYPLHGSLLDIKCSNKDCDYIDKDNFQDPICPALEVKDPKTSFALQPKETAPSTSKADEIASDLSTLAIKDSAKKLKSRREKTNTTTRPPT